MSREIHKAVSAGDVAPGFDSLRISIASPDQIRSWSYGEVKKPETINYRTFKPEREGLFCARIFGPIKDYECLCGKYKRMKYRGIVCEKCGVEVTLSKVRRDRMGHIDLASPVAHIWFTKSLPSRLGNLLDVTLRDLERVLYFENYIVTDPGLTPFKYKQLLSEEEFMAAQDEYGEDAFSASIGAEALRDILNKLDLKQEQELLRQEYVETTSEIRKKKVFKRLKLIDAFIESNTNPVWLIMEVIPVIPPELRPLVPLDGGRFATSDLNDLYRRVINRNNRLKRLIELRAPDIIVRNELKLHQCGLPKKMALELFRPFIYSRLERYGLASTLKAAKRMVEKERLEVWDVLEDVIREHPVLLNRAPTLHRLGIQAFEPILIEGKAIQLHPLVCAAFNADFDGDQMAVHIPLSLEAQLEARVLMMSTNNILSPANSRPIIVPSKDIVLGLYYLSLEKEDGLGQGMLISDVSELEHALMDKRLEIHSKIQGRIPHYQSDGSVYFKRVETTVGRMILGQYLPKNANVPFELINQVLTSGEINNLVDIVHRHCTQKETVIFVDRIMGLGFTYMTKGGISFGKDDLIVPLEKEKFVQETKTMVNEFEQQYLDGLITQGEKYNKVVDAWSSCTDKVAEAMMKTMSRPNKDNSVNSVYMMTHSKARGSVAQMKQLGGMRGLMAKPSGDIIETPIISNFKEGLNVLEYFISTHGTRKGLADTALKTATSGYLTRRLVDVAQDCIISEEDCGTQRGLKVRAVTEGSNVIVSLAERILGRCATEDVIHPQTGQLILSAGELIDEPKVDQVIASGLDEIKIRSVLTCDTRQGICSKCYGRDMARGTLVCEGETVGVIAAQSIGEPGTQLTLRTFHIGGAAQRGAENSSIESAFAGSVSLVNTNVQLNSQGNAIALSRNGELLIMDEQNRERTRYKIPYGARMLVKNTDAVKTGTRLFEWDPYTLPILTEHDGIAHFVDLIDGQSMREVVEEATGISSRVVVDWKQLGKTADLRPMISSRDAKGNPIVLGNGIEARYLLPVDTIVSIENTSHVKAGDVIARIPRETTKTRDITGGLPRVSELLEARHPKDAAIIAEFDGRVEFGKDYKAKRRILVIPEDEHKKPAEYLIPKGRHITVHEGDHVRKGELLVDGNPVPHDILRIMGVEALAEYLVSEVQQVYRLQGVSINDKHLEVIVRQMLQKLEITDSGDSGLIIGEQVDRLEVEEMNRKLLADGKRPIEGSPVLQGITKASLHTKSFISAASFQDTTRVLTEASVAGKVDVLAGLKENVIVGRLIPAGTGGIIGKLKALSSVKNSPGAESMINVDVEASNVAAESQVA